jgi:two-component system, OmpR family, alkaline phosphatase synthesis response regulator PhoP
MFLLAIDGVVGMKNSSRKKILIVEDEEHIASAEKMILEDDYHVYLSSNGLNGFDLIKREKPDLVVLDVMLPGLNGFDICRRIRAEKSLKNTKIVMVTAKNEDKDEIRGMDLGADDYIMKPFEASELKHVIKQVLKE